MTTILVTGALGHIGSQLVRSFAQSFPGAHIRMVDNLSTQRYASLFHLPPGASYEFHEADILTADLAPLVKGVDAVVHLAAITDATSSFSRPAEVEAVNLRGTERVALAAAEAGAGFVFASTTSVYGPHGDRVDERCAPDDLRPQSPYAASKLQAERLLEEMARTNDLRFVTFRFGTIFGTSIGMRFHTAVNRFCWQAVFGQPLTVWRDAYRQVRPYLELGDGIRATELAIRKELFDNTVYNAVTVNATVEDVVEAIRAHVPDLRVSFVDTPIMNQLSYEVSSERLRKLGFEPAGDLGRSIAETTAWLRDAYRLRSD